MNIAEFLTDSARRFPTRPAVSDLETGDTLTFKELHEKSMEMASFLEKEGVTRATRVGLHCPNSLAHLIAAFGVLYAKACLVPVADNLTDHEVQTILGEIEVEYCLAWASGRPVLENGATSSTQKTLGSNLEFRFYRYGEVPGPPGFEALNPAFIRFTSGTTGKSKGVVLAHEDTAARVEFSDQVLGLTEEDRILWILPLAYHFAVTIVAYVRAGAHILLCGDTLPRAVGEAIESHRPTILYASPIHVARLSRRKGKDPLSSLRLAVSTAAPITEKLVRDFEAGCGVPLAQAYGIIEAGLPCINTRGPEDPVFSVGKPVPGYEIALFSQDGDRVIGEGDGEIGIQSRGLFSAYYSPWTLRDQVLVDGWFRTGDIGRFDAQGALQLLGRKKTMIFVAGMKFFPEEVEDCLNSHPRVRESRVTAKTHPHLGEIPIAQVVLSLDAVEAEVIPELKRLCAERLSSFKMPAEMKVVEMLPKTGSGKILRRG